MKNRTVRARVVASLAGAASVFSAVALGACSSSSSPSQPSGTSDASADTSTAQDSAASDAPSSPEAAADSAAPTMTIAKARQAFLDAGSAPAITVNAIVTAVQGPTGDQVNWYVEDPAGGPYSGIIVFCDPLAAKTCPCMSTCSPHVAAPPVGTLVSISGTISAYHGQLQLVPTAQTTLQADAGPLPVYTASASDLAETASSPYRGVYVKFPSTVTVDNLTPSPLYDSECNTDGGAGMPLCSGCTPPSFAGFEVNGPGTGAFFVEETFFPFVPLASSPECLTQSGAVVVTKGETFPFMAGILDVDPYAGDQVLSPTQPSDYGP
jgi:hypothetical protein